MIEKIIFASKNKHKIEEIKNMFSGSVKNIIPLDDEYDDIIEDGNSFYENAFIKSNHVYKNLNTVSLGDDSGLCIEALDGKPGIFSARYAGEQATQEQKIEKILIEMNNVSDIEKRKAYFATSAVLIISDNLLIHTKGFVYGLISFEPHGSDGFGYDPIFIPDGYDKTFAELGSEIKNSISHRYIAMAKMSNIISNMYSYANR